MGKPLVCGQPLARGNLLLPARTSDQGALGGGKKLHWRKDAILREDDKRCRNRNVVTNLMLLRNLALHFYVHTCENGPMTAWIVQNNWNLRGVLRSLTKKSWFK